ncbi:Cyclin, N-terminal domain-containing protein, partial [Baffinella frigidus]
YLKQAEARSLVSPSYMLMQTDINGAMRAILNDWLVDVHRTYNMQQETLYLCFQIIDRFLERQQVNHLHLQLVGVTSMMLAAKYEEVSFPEIRDYIYICDNAFTRKQILEMEQLILSTLEFRLSLPTVWAWMPSFAKAAGYGCDQDPMFLNLNSHVGDVRSEP